jgi:Uncharacterized protein conserved in bacteria (DUF2188)
MIIFDVPYAPKYDGNWSVAVSNDGHSEFTTRTDALRFAVDSALDAKRHGDESMIAIEGSDGRWRMFDHRAKGVA